MIILVNTAVADEIAPAYTVELEQIETLPDAKIQTVSGEFKKTLDKNGYILTPQEKNSALIFTISDTNIDFSDIISAREKISSTLLRVNSAGTLTYEIIGSLKQPLKSSLNEIIPQTDKNSYGWGFQLSGSDVVSPYKDENQIFDEDKQMIFAENESLDKESVIKLTFKVRVSPKQKEGNYTGIIKLIAVPKI